MLLSYYYQFLNLPTTHGHATSENKSSVAELWTITNQNDYDYEPHYHTDSKSLSVSSWFESLLITLGGEKKFVQYIYQNIQIWLWTLL